MKKGELVPNADVVYLLKEGIRKVASSKGILIDGCPRVKDQCCDFEVAIAPIDLMIYLECTEKTMVERVLKEAKESGGKRPNDNEETVRARITTFFKNNDPILNLYTKRKKIINGDRDVDEVFADVQKCIEELMAKLNES
ncbi:Adenylate kinase isoenzyme 1 [Pseudolycoriella hygida]|uniref:Adenylate kinase isoenzyme 1 n=1 Tax=Pseudolycoriella hygida TaxID=35572 RepID=A0A9Q0N8P4_9DIPT|nr:Adenylate kinase isoenzyme 1 [Pseudolycoriella hygida]